MHCKNGLDFIPGIPSMFSAVRESHITSVIKAYYLCWCAHLSCYCISNEIIIAIWLFPQKKFNSNLHPVAFFYMYIFVKLLHILVTVLNLCNWELFFINDILPQWINSHMCVQCAAFMYVQMKECDDKQRAGLPAGPWYPLMALMECSVFIGATGAQRTTRHGNKLV